MLSPLQRDPLSTGEEHERALMVSSSSSPPPPPSSPQGQNPFPMSMPPAEQVLLRHYPLDIVEQAISIFSLDDTIANEQLTYEDARYTQIRVQQAEMVDEVLYGLSRSLQGTTILLSYYMVKIMNSDLCSYLDTDLRTWLRSKGIELKIILIAEELYKIWPFLHALEFTIEEVFTTDFTQEKVPYIARLDKEQYSAKKKQYERERDRRCSERHLPTLPKEEDDVLWHEVEQNYQVKAQVAVRRILDTPLDALQAEERQEKQQGEQPKVYLTGEYRGGCFYYDRGVIPLDYAEFMFLTHGPVHVVGFNGKSSRAYAEAMLEHVLPPEEED